MHPCDPARGQAIHADQPGVRDDRGASWVVGGGDVDAHGHSLEPRRATSRGWHSDAFHRPESSESQQRFRLRHRLVRRASFLPTVDPMRRDLVEQRRQRARDRLSGPAPIVERRQELLDTIRDHQVVVIAGETARASRPRYRSSVSSSGGRRRHDRPHPTAAPCGPLDRRRVADELGTEVGDLVGYSVRFTDEVSDRTLVKAMTDGILLAELQRDPDLRRYDTIIIDEAHERTLNIDFLLGYLRRLVERRDDLH